MKKKEIKNIINQGWEARRAKSDERKRKNNEWTKLWKEKEKLVKILKSYEKKAPPSLKTTLDKIDHSRRPNYITSPGSDT